MIGLKSCTPKLMKSLIKEVGKKIISVNATWSIFFPLKVKKGRRLILRSHAELRGVTVVLLRSSQAPVLGHNFTSKSVIQASRVIHFNGEYTAPLETSYIKLESMFTGTGNKLQPTKLRCWESTSIIIPISESLRWMAILSSFTDIYNHIWNTVNVIGRVTTQALLQSQEPTILDLPVMPFPLRFRFTVYIVASLYTESKSSFPPQHLPCRCFFLHPRHKFP